MVTRFPGLAAAALAVGLAFAGGAAQAADKASTPALQRVIDAVVTGAKAGVGQQISTGIVLRQVRQHGDIVMFDLKLVNPVMLETARGNAAYMQRIFARDFGAKLCRKGSGTRQFVDMGGEIQVVFWGNRREMLSGGRLTRC